MRILWIVYVAGVLIGLWRTDARPLTRVALALLWPIGPITFALVVTILLASSLIAFPKVAIGAAALAGVAWWALA